MLIAQTPSGVKFQEFPPAWLATPEAKDFLYRRAIPALLRSWKATRVAFAMSSWYKELPVDRNLSQQEIENLPQVRHMSDYGVRSLPDKKEGVLMYLVDKVHERTYIADIHRHDDRPPELDRFRLFEGAKLSGRVIEGLRSALR